MAAVPPPPPMGLKQPRPPAPPTKKGTPAERKTHEPVRGGVARSFEYFNEKSPLGAGLSNQGATCYVNSLIQTLYYTPEFRSKIYQWKSDTPFDPNFCIPLQLQKLFARMQHGLTNSVETKQLTNSFGWEESDAFEQHDVQELTNVLFDALERTHKKGSSTAKDTFVSHFYKGFLNDYIKCTKCKNVRRRKDGFLDLQLSIRGLNSVEEALQAFVTPEYLNGDNQYFCEKCEAKCDAEKGLSLTELPQILTLQLKRFDFDYATWRRLKLNNKISFPFTLDMTPYLEKVEVEHKEKEENKEEAKTDKKETTLEETNSNTEKGETKSNGATQKEEEKSNLYELFSVMVHSGGASGGHYYAFVKKADSGQWIKVNDINVSLATDNEVKQMFGEDTAGGKVPLASTNAYMLHYRQASSSKTPAPITEILPTIKAEIEGENEQFLKEKAEYIKRRDNLTIKVSYLDNPYVVNIDKHKTLADLHALVHQTLTSSVPDFTTQPQDMRMRNFTMSTQTVADPLVLDSDGGKSLDSLGFYPNKQVVVETRLAGTEFAAASNEISLKILPLDKDLEFMSERVVAAKRDATLAELKQKIFSEFFNAHAPSPQDVQILRVVQNPANNMQQEIFVLDGGGDDTRVTLSGEGGLGMVDGAVLYVERKPEDGTESSLRKRFEMELHMIEISFNKPGTKVFDQPLGVDKRKSLRELKVKIGKLLDIPAEEIKVCKNMISGEFKTLDASIDDCGIFDGCTIFIERGKPMTQGEVRIALVQRNNEEFTKLGDVTVSDKLPVSELRKMAKEKTGWEFVRLRERRGNKVTSILVDTETLKEAISALKDGSEVVLEKLDKEEYLHKGQLLLELRGWNPNTWELTESKEIIVEKNATVDDIITLVSTQENIEVKYLQIAKPIRFHLTDPAMIYGLNWEVDFARVLTKSPWYLVDGDFLYWKDIRIQEKVPENAVFAKQKEKGVKILTPYDDDFIFEDEAEPQKEKEQEKAKEEEKDKDTK